MKDHPTENAKAGMANSDCGWTCGCAGKTEIPWEHVPYLSASVVVIDYEEALWLYQVYRPLSSFTFIDDWPHLRMNHNDP